MVPASILTRGRLGFLEYAISIIVQRGCHKVLNHDTLFTYWKKCAIMFYLVRGGRVNAKN